MRGSMITGPSIAVLIIFMYGKSPPAGLSVRWLESLSFRILGLRFTSGLSRLRKRAFVFARETCVAACLWILQYLLVKVYLSERDKAAEVSLSRHRNRPIRELPCCPAAPSPNIRRTVTTNIVFFSFGCGVPFRLFTYLVAVGRIWPSRTISVRRAVRRRIPVNSLTCSADIPAASIFLATSALPSASPASARTRAPWRNSVCRPRTPVSGGSSSSPSCLAQ